MPTVIKPIRTSSLNRQEQDESVVGSFNLSLRARTETQPIRTNTVKSAKIMQGMRGCGVADHVCVADSMAYTAHAGYADFMHLPLSV